MLLTQFNVREQYFEDAQLEMAGSAEEAARIERTVRNNLGRMPETELRRMAQRVDTPGRLATAELAMRQGAHMGNVDTTNTAPRANRIADEIREAAAEVEVDTEAAEPQLEGTTPGRRDVETNFARRARAMLEDGTLAKLGRFWQSLMKKPGQRTLPPVNSEDLVERTREAVRAGGPIPADVLTELARRYNEALKESARQWAQDHNQVFDEANWIDPLGSVSAQGSGRTAGFSLRLYGIGRGGANPYTVRQNSDRTYFSADTSIHATGLADAPGSADLAYRFAALHLLRYGQRSARHLYPVAIRQFIPHGV
jgi:hypothetical protein